MRFAVSCRVAVAGLTALAAVACQGDVTEPDSFDIHVSEKKDDAGGGGGGNDTNGPDNKKGDLYADLVFLLRDVNGLPILKSFEGEEGPVLCEQPVSYAALPVLDPAVTIEEADNPVNGRHVWLIPLYGDYMVPPPATGEIGVLSDEEEVALAPCDPYGELADDGTLVWSYGDYAQEVHFGRLNLGRAPLRTVDRAYSEVELKLRTAGYTILGHAGRWGPDGVLIDAPAENLVIHREMQLRGEFAPYGSPVPAGWTSAEYTFLDHAASTLAGAADKFGEVNEDLVVYNNRILGFPDAVEPGGLGTITGDGTSGFPGEKYLDYGDFEYTRSAMFPGCVAYAYYDEGGQLQNAEGRIFDVVFGGSELEASNIHGFAMRADDARAVIYFEHSVLIGAIDRIGETAVCAQLGL